MIPAPAEDASIGIEFFCTSSRGMGGRIRQKLEDFLVEEVYQPQEYEGGRYLILEVEKAGWDTHHLIRELSRALRISQKRFSFAGTKDKWAVTRQRMSIMGLEPSSLEGLKLPGVKIKVLGSSNRYLGLGDLQGNRFRVTIRDMKCDESEARTRFEAITREIETMGGLANYFGVQRFGEIRPVTHLVGEALVSGDIELAVFRYLAMPFPKEVEETRVARQRLWDERDIGQALREYPVHLSFELAILNYLSTHPQDYAHCFDVLAPNLKKMFVHAYQSFLFNKILSRRLARGLPLTPLEGDVVCFTRGNQPDIANMETVTKGNLEAVLRLSRYNRAYVALPLFGYESSLASGLPGEIEASVLEEASLENDDFLIRENPSLGSPGTRRPAMFQVHPVYLPESDGATLEFILPRGSYATVVLREYMKPG